MLGSLVAVCLLAADPTPFTAQKIVGAPASGVIKSLGPSGVELEAEGQTVKLAASELLSLSPTTPPQAAAPEADKPAVWVYLVDGAQFIAEKFEVKAGKASVGLLGGGSLEFDAKRLALVRFARPDERTEQALQTILSAKHTGDSVIVRKGDQFDFLDGSLGDITAETLDFVVDGERIPVKRAKTEAILYSHTAPSKLAPGVCLVRDRFAGVWPAAKVELTEAGVAITTRSGVAVLRPLADVAGFDFSQGKLVYLSDLAPQSVEWLPYFAPPTISSELRQFFRPRNDRALSGGPLTVKMPAAAEGAAELDQRFDKGLSIHSRTKLTWRLTDAYRRFQAVTGIDRSQQDRGHVQLVIQGDDRTLFEGVISGKQPARVLDLDLTGVRKLTILVDYGEDLDVSDHLNLCDARIRK